MKSLIAKRHLIRQNMIAIIGLALSIYFGYHLMAGERSYWQLSLLQSEVSSAEQDLAVLSSQKSGLEEKVVMMRPGSINRDLLEEQVRTVLGYRSSDETVIIQN